MGNISIIIKFLPRWVTSLRIRYGGLSLEQELKRAEEKVSLLKSLLEQEKIKLKESYKREEYLEEDIRNLRREKFRRFNDEECWIWNGENVADNYIDSLVCPVVISPSNLKDILKKAGML